MTKIFARMYVTPDWSVPVGGERVAEIVTEHEDIGAEWPAAFLATCVEVTDLKTKPQPGWVYNADGTFSPPPPFVPSPARVMAAALAAGLTVTSISTPALSATYDGAGPRWQRMRDEAQYVATFSRFSGGLSELDWTARSGEVIFTTPAQLLAVVQAVGDWQSLWQRFVDGKAGDPPAGTATIA